LIFNFKKVLTAETVRTNQLQVFFRYLSYDIAVIETDFNKRLKELGKTMVLGTRNKKAGAIAPAYS